MHFSVVDKHAELLMCPLAIGFGRFKHFWISYRVIVLRKSVAEVYAHTAAQRDLCFLRQVLDTCHY